VSSTLTLPPSLPPPLPPFLSAIGSPIPGPSLLNDGESWRVFHKLDRTFGKPRVYAIFQVSPSLPRSLPSSLLITVFQNPIR